MITQTEEGKWILSLQCFFGIRAFAVLYQELKTAHIYSFIHACDAKTSNYYIPNLLAFILQNNLPSYVFSNKFKTTKSSWMVKNEKSAAALDRRFGSKQRQRTREMKGKGKGTGKDTVMNGDAAEAAVGIPGLGPVMSLDDPTYLASDSFHSGCLGIT